MVEETSQGSAPQDKTDRDTVRLAAVPPWRLLGKCAVLGGISGVMVALGLMTLSRLAMQEGGMSFAGWAGRAVHDGIFQKPGEKLASAIHGEDEALMLRGDIRAMYVLICVAAGGAVVGLLAGLAAGILRLRRGTARQPELFLPWTIPLSAAILGLFYHGFILGNAAVFLLRYSRRRCACATAAVWALAFLAVAGWAWAMETDWPEGWSKMYPWARSVFFFLGHMVGAKE
jgi:hypothetical protein